MITSGITNARLTIPRNGIDATVDRTSTLAPQLVSRVTFKPN